MRKAVAPAVLLLCAATLNAAAAETALEVQSWCRPILNSHLQANGAIDFEGPVRDTGFCWGAFAAIQDISRLVWEGTTPAMRVCAPADSTRLQLIKIFSKYVDDHPETAHESFGGIAVLSLRRAFPCPE